MSKLSQEIRKDIPGKKAINKYLKYAFGEIILMVISILLAVQVDDWNRKRIETNEVHTIIENLGNEFNQNKSNLQLKIEELDSSFYNARKLIDLVGKSKSELKRHNIDSLLAISFKYKKFNPSEDVISALLQSGRLKLLKKNTIKDLLFHWSRDRIALNEHFEDLDDNTSKVLSYLTQNYSLRDFDVYTDKKLTGPSNLKIDKYAIFEDIVFENHLENHIYYIHGYGERLKKTKKIINEIISFVKAKELEKESYSPE
ncbi:MAG: hypothetical protein JXR05_04160 [Flavobacteriaceae bacterium]